VLVVETAFARGHRVPLRNVKAQAYIVVALSDVALTTQTFSLETHERFPAYLIEGSTEKHQLYFKLSGMRPEQ
jgi:hypothetical protein